MRYELEKYSGPASRHTCPGCGEKKQFTLYVDTTTGELLPPPYGRCNREIKCAYNLKPEQDINTQTFIPKKPVEEKTDYIAAHIWGATVKKYGLNPLFKWVAGIFGEAKAREAFDLYQVGTSKAYGGAPIFWQFDEVGRCHGGKIMGYNAETGKRVKEPQAQITWAHSLLKIEPFNFKSVLFGLHLAEQNKDATINIVESEKTALVCAIQMPDRLWMATGGIQNLVFSKLHPIRKRHIVLHPDLGAYDVWAQKMEGMNIEAKISTDLEKFTGTLPTGFDLCDLFSTKIEMGNVINSNGYPQSWD
jgi:hypothetical protein